MSETLTLDLEGIVSADEARRLLALALYHDGKVSLARAASLAQVPLEEWIPWAAKQGVVLWGDDYDLDGDLKRLEALDS
ncbi:MAG: UPF0175 family protein [Planctomycetes bacterium]|nr:UPF0175 family protein [Planctomycetota bacterium]